MSWPLIDRGAPINWPFYKARVKLVRKYPKLYGIVWFDFR